MKRSYSSIAALSSALKKKRRRARAGGEQPVDLAACGGSVPHLKASSRMAWISPEESSTTHLE